jgi:glycosyltransferase involved in cell wall biosynthesis
MRIAIDLTPIPYQKTGVGKYALGLLNALNQNDETNEYYLFVKRGFRKTLNLEADNFQVIECSNYLGLRLLRLLWEQLILPLQLVKMNIQVLHSIHYTLPFLAPCKTVVTFHDMTFFLFPEKHTFVKRYFFKLFIRISSKRATRLVAVSENTKKDMIELLGIRAEKISVIYETVDSRYRPIDDKHLSEELSRKYGIKKRFILYVGTLEPRKNVTFLLKAYHKLSIDYRISHQLVIVGKKGWGYKDIFSTAESLAMGDQVLFTGYVPEDELPFLYNSADLFVYPSLYEGFGIPPLEALSCGTPTISSDISSMPEVVGNAGLLVDPHNVNQLSKAMYDVLMDIELRRNLSQAGLNRAKRFAPKEIATQMLKTYELTAKEK